MIGNVVESVDACLQRAHVRGALVVGVSGGMDSVVLAHVLQGLALPRGLNIHIAHFDHALRPASADDARFVAALAASWGLPFHTTRWAHGDHFPAGVEAAARATRYSFLAAVARAVTPAAAQPCIVVAHHTTDQAETLLLQLMRGSGLHGLAAMRTLSTWTDGELPPVQIVRPLLRTPQEVLAAYAAAHALAWRADESNDDSARTRNFVRHAVIPLLAQRNPAIVDTLARTASLLAQEADRLDLLDDHLLAQALVESSRNTRLLLRCAVLRSASWGDRCAILRRGLKGAFDARAVGLAHIETLAAAIEGQPHATGPHPLVDDIAWSIVCDNDVLLLSLHPTHGLPLQPATPWLDEGWRAACGTLPLAVGDCIALTEGWMLSVVQGEQPVDDSRADPWSLWIDRQAAGTLRLTTPHAGMRMAPRGMDGHTRSLGDIFTDRKIARALRPGWPIITDATGRVLWLCGLVVAAGATAHAGAPALHLRWTQTDKARAA